VRSPAPRVTGTTREKAGWFNRTVRSPPGGVTHRLSNLSNLRALRVVPEPSLVDEFAKGTYWVSPGIRASKITFRNAAAGWPNLPAVPVVAQDAPTAGARRTRKRCQTEMTVRKGAAAGVAALAAAGHGTFARRLRWQPA
jgi:hypothetical protein